MGSLEILLATVDEVEIAKNVGIFHDEARMHYSPGKNTIESFDEFVGVLAEYYNHHVSKCVIHGGFLSHTEAAGRAKELLQQEYRKKGGNINTAYNDAHDGTNGGLRIILDRVAEQLKAESVERYIRDAFDRYVDPTSWEQKVDIIRQFIGRFGHMLSSAIHPDQPERYAQNYEELIRAYVDGLRATSSAFRRF